MQTSKCTVCMYLFIFNAYNLLQFPAKAVKHQQFIFTQVMNDLQGQIID